MTEIKDQEIKKAREAFQAKFKTKEDSLHPILDDPSYLRLKTAKRSTASKSNIDVKEKEYRKSVISYEILDLAKSLLFLTGRTRQRRKFKSDVRVIQTAVKL